ncbi:hypothetical protein T4E_6906 [Trichinella pseudospiralis]|uniref:Uncharacterized protein n=1 Tax=Trichinella pseudospiralis TaxID=6337 RepID=A0A0V0YJQ1_TRIPS|nr:hypothetical protein T4E_6906 [Trichinella pseudospiralis]
MKNNCSFQIKANMRAKLLTLLLTLSAAVSTLVEEDGKIVLTIPHSKEFWIDTTLRKNPIWINNPTLDPIQK